MKLTKLTEARYSTGPTQIFVKEAIGSYENIGPFSSEEEAKKFIEKVSSLFDFHNDLRILKIVETQSPRDYLEGIMAEAKEKAARIKLHGKKKLVRRKVPKKVRSLRKSRQR